jgi:hypothetical protein
MKMTALQGVIFATLILAVIGGALQLASTQLQNVDLTWMGSYRMPFLAFFQNAWIIIVATFLYNVFMYFRQNQLAALKQTAELYDWRKLVTTLTWFVGILGPMAAFITDTNTKGIITLVVIIATAITQEMAKIFGVDTSATQPTTAVSTTTALVTSATSTPVGTYQGWAVKIVNGFLQLYPPAAFSALGQMIGLGSVIGYPLTSDFLGMTKAYIDQKIAEVNAPRPTPEVIPPPAT